jgi:cell division protein FtsL
MEQITQKEIEDLDNEISQRFSEDESLKQEIKQYYIKQQYSNISYNNIIKENNDLEIKKQFSFKNYK